MTRIVGLLLLVSYLSIVPLCFSTPSHITSSEAMPASIMGDMGHTTQHTSTESTLAHHMGVYQSVTELFTQTLLLIVLALFIVLILMRHPTKLKFFVAQRRPARRDRLLYYPKDTAWFSLKETSPPLFI